MNQGVQEIKILGLKEKQLGELSNRMLLSLNKEEWKAIQEYYSKLKRNPTDVELETIAQTWSEHCKHKVFNAIINYVEVDDKGKRKKLLIDSLFNSFIKKSTLVIARKKNWLVSVFSDNAGIIEFNNSFDLAFKVETHNHPSALDPYGGAGTGIGGVIRDIIGAGLGAKPIANTDVFCFGPFDFDFKKLPPKILHPKRIAKGVRAGVGDYGNRMGIPTLNGAILFDERYLGNPLVYCGTLGIMPKGLGSKSARPGDQIIVVGGRTGRDGIHGVTFASTQLTESTPSTPVQIGNPIEEKKVLDVILQARDLKLYDCITDCGGGGFSSAIGEMSRELGCKVYLDKAPLKYKGLSPWEIWVSESQERMILSVPPENVQKTIELFNAENVEATVIGEFTANRKLELYYNNNLVCKLDMKFLHKGLPRRNMKALWHPASSREPKLKEQRSYDLTLKKILGMPNIASKESTIRQYDHEVQGCSVLKPLAGAENDGPNDAAIIRPLFDSSEAVIVSNGINPLYGDLDTYWMAASAIDEALRNIIAVGGSLEKIALLDNFCWGSPENQFALGQLVRAVQACHDFSLIYETPFVSGKDSFYNEFIVGKKTISIPSTLLISAIGVIPEASKRISMDLKEERSLIYIAGTTFNELGASHYLKLHGFIGRNAPKVNALKAKKLYESISRISAMGEKNSERLIRSMHDCSEGGLAVAAAEMAFAGMIGMEIELSKVVFEGVEKDKRNDALLFSESNSRLLIEVPEKFKQEFESLMQGNPFALIGRTVKQKKFIVKGLNGKEIINSDLSELKNAWKQTLKW
ncbi:MAG: phosphoribosylformylglycinamidine synthase subunit PurL [Candidatus Diapherotrites archaeon]